MGARSGWDTKVKATKNSPFVGSSAVLALIIPVAAIVGACFYLCYWVLQSSAHQTGAAEFEAEQRIAKAAILFTTAPVVKTDNDYANWDELFTRAKKPLDPKWADAVLGSYQQNFAGVTGSAVLTGSGALRYLYLSPRSGMHSLTPPELRLFTSIVQSVIAEKRPEWKNTRTGFVMLRGKPVFLAVTPIQASGLEGAPKNEKPFAALIFFMNFDTGLLSGLTKSFNLADARIVPAAKAGIVLPNFPGAPADLGLAWKTRIISQDIIGKTLPLLKVLAALSLLLVAAVAAGWSWVLVRIRKMEAAALTERTLNAEQTAQMKSMFVANMSHELRTPLNAIIGFSEMYANQVFGPLGHRKYAEYAEDILASGRHLLSVVNNILLMSKLDAKKHEYEIAAVAVDDVIHEAVMLVSGDAGKRNVSIDWSDDEKVTAFADRQALKQVLINLLSNAVKFSPTGGQVGVTAREIADTGAVELRVSDQGCGMPEEFLKKLGQPFTQASHAYVRGHQGTGLGLSICFGLVAGFGGVLEFQSAEGMGTTATLVLRAVPAQSAAFQQPEAQAA